jgi:hypothetical protein
LGTILVFLGLVSETLVVEAKAHTGITQILAGIGWAEGQIDVDATEILIGRGKDIALIPEREGRVGISKSSDSNSV